MRVDRLPSVVIEPEPARIAAEEIASAEEEVKSSTVEARTFEDSGPPVPEAHPSAKILGEAHELMRRYFGPERPKEETTTSDVLKILGLDASKLLSTACNVTAPVPEDEADTLLSKPESVIKLPSHSGIAAAPAVVDEVDAVDEERAPTPWTKRPVGDVLLEGNSSARLSNCIEANRDFFSDWTIGRAMIDRSKFAAALMHVRNLGRKTANEALAAVDAYARNQRIREGELGNKGDEKPEVDPLATLEPTKLDASITTALKSRSISTRLANLLATGDIDDLTVRDFILHPDVVRVRMLGCKRAGRKTVNDAFELLSSHVEWLRHPDAGSASVQAEDEPPVGLTTREWIEQEISALPTNRVEVLYSRYGLDGQHPRTLQEIADRVHVTRERVRQVEAGAIKRLRAGLRSRAAFVHYLAESKESQWAILFGQQLTIPKDEVSERFRRLDPWFLLSIDIVFEDGRDGYLNANAYKTAGSWFKSSDEAEGWQKLNHVMGDILNSYRTPMPVDTLEEVAPWVRAPSSAEGDTWTLCDGYVFTGRVGSRARRTGRMHAVARRIAQSGVFDIGSLIIEYRSEFPEDECSSRIFEMHADEAPHLFVPVFDGIWLCLDRTSCNVDCLPAPPFERRSVEEPHFAEGSLGDLLIKRLARLGPQRMIDLRRTIIDSAQGSFSESSVGAVLLCNPCFRRAAPGIFGLYGEGSDMSVALDAHLLGDRHCRFYCHARYAGAPQDYYPLWGAAYEMRLAVWAEQHAATELYRSLMAVIDPETWPAQPETIAEFQTRRSRDGRWEIGAERRLPFGHRFLDSGQFLSTLAHLVVFGWISWVGVNRATGSKSDNHDAADVLAFFVMTGLVEPELDWQAPHHPTDLAKRLFLEARLERHLHGDDVSKGRGVFDQLRSMLYEAPPTASRGWVDIEEFTAAMPAWQLEGIRTGKAFDGAQSRQLRVNAEESFESDDWDAVFGG